jgi:hypothetical protein
MEVVGNIEDFELRQLIIHPIEVDQDIDTILSEVTLIVVLNIDVVSQKWAGIHKGIVDGNWAYVVIQWTGFCKLTRLIEASDAVLTVERSA